MDGSWGRAQLEAHRPSVGGLDKLRGRPRAGSSLAPRGSALPASGVAWPGACTEQPRVEGGEESGHGSRPGTSGECGREERPRGPGDRRVRRGVQATPEMGNGKTHSTAGPSGGPGAALERPPGHEEGHADRTSPPVRHPGPQAGARRSGAALVALRAVTLAFQACIEVCRGLWGVNRLVGAVLL